jgi:RbsD / FucU transport protein family
LTIARHCLAEASGALGLEAIPSAATVGGEKALELGCRGARSAKVVSRSFGLQELKMEWYVRPKAGGNMLLGLDPLLTPDLLHALAAMGHGDRIVLVDANYPATHGRWLILLLGVDTPRALQASWQRSLAGRTNGLRPST